MNSSLDLCCGESSGMFAFLSEIYSCSCFSVRYSNVILGTTSIETSYALSKRLGGSCSFEAPVVTQVPVSPTAVMLGCAAVAVAAAIGCAFIWTRYGANNSIQDSPAVRQDKFIRRNLIIIAIAEFMMTLPNAGIPLLFATRIQRIMCSERHLPCSDDSVFPSDSVISDANIYSNYLSSAVGASNFFGTLLIGSVSDIVGRRICIIVVAFGLVADSLFCMFCDDLEVLNFALLILSI
jgi:hypothetical protein